MGFISKSGQLIKRAFGAVTKSFGFPMSTGVFFRGAADIWRRFRSTKARYEAAYWLTKFNECSILQRPIRRLMEDFAAVPFKLKRKRLHHNGRIVLDDVFGHRSLALLEKPNPSMTGVQFKELWEQSLSCTGIFLVYIVFGADGFPEALWPIGADKIKELPDPSRGRLTWKFCGPLGEDVKVGMESVMFDRLVNGSNVYGKGVGLCTGISREIKMFEAATDWSLNFFQNGSHVGAIVHIPDLQEGEGEKLQAHWEKNHTGADNAHKTLFVTTSGGEGKAAVTVNKMGSSHRELDYSQGITDLKDRVRENFNLPAELVGDSKNTNRAGSTASENFHQKNNIKPRCMRACAFLNCFYMPLWKEPDLVLTFEDPVKEDQALAHKRMLDGVKNGCATRDEWRELSNMDPMETELTSGLSVPLNMVIISEDGRVIFSPSAEDNEKPPEPDGDQAEQIDKQASDVLTKVALSLEALK